jgi:histidinol-phosphate aminotransferase
VTQQNKAVTWRDNLISVEPYVPGEQLRTPGLIKLNTNENPFPPSPAVKGALRSTDITDLRRYPDPDATPLRQLIAKQSGLAENQVFIGNGSDEILAFAFRAFFNSGRPVLFPDVTYSFYPVWCKVYRIPYEEIPVDGDFRVRAEDYDRPNGGIVLANPNAPTGIGEGPQFVESLLRSNPDNIVIIDEAYVDFGGHSSTGLMSKYDNLFITRTFSKSRSLAGLRLGVGFGSPEAISVLNDLKNSINSYTVDSIAMRVGAVAADDTAYYTTQVEKLMRIRYKYMKALRSMGFTVLESSANFIFVNHGLISAYDLYLYLKEHNILVRHFDKPRISDWLRISIGTKMEMDRLLEMILRYMDEEM